MADGTNDATTAQATQILGSVRAGEPVAPGVHVLPAQGNGLAIETPDGVILVDVGRGGKQTAGRLAALRANLLERNESWTDLAR